MMMIDRIIPGYIYVSGYVRKICPCLSLISKNSMISVEVRDRP